MKLFTPGPISMDPETLQIGSVQSQYFRTDAFSELMLDCKDKLDKVIDSPADSRTIFLTSSGTAAMEAVVINLFDENDKVLIINGGSFGSRFSEICNIHNIPHEEISLLWDQPFDYHKLYEYKNKGITGLLVNVCETSTGQLYNMDEISKFCKENNICLVADAISTFLCDSFSMKKWNIDVTIISSQKGLALNPGMSFIIIKGDTFDKRVKNRKVKSLYLNFNNYYPEILRGQTPFTPGINIINQLHDKLTRLLKNGSDYYVNINKSNAEYFRSKLLKETEYLIPEYPLSNCVTPVLCKGIHPRFVTETLKNNYDIFVIPPPLHGELSDKLFRVAHMSTQLTHSDIDELIGIIKNIKQN